jgi:uncharacterized membrane protein HdeD (DUF308 family)
VSVTPERVAERAYWLVPTLRALPALVLGLVITFTADHSARLGLVLFGLFAVVSGILILGLNRRIGDQVVRRIFLVVGLVAVICGCAALVGNAGGLGLLLFLLTVFAATTGFLELYAGLRTRGRLALSRDWVVVGAFTAIAALVFLIIPPDSLAAVGLLGAYGIVLGVYLAIAGLSLKWAPQDGSTAARSTESEK